MTSRISRWVLAGAALALAAGTGISPAGAVTATPPHVVARPNNLMVNTKTTLTGTGFPARKKLTVEECSRTGWVVTANPCVKDNRITVTTDAHGRFTRQFRVALCGGSRGPGPTSQVCYIGVPHPEGVDTISLIGAARVVVTYP